MIALWRQSDQLDSLLREIVRGSKVGRPKGRLERKSISGQEERSGLV